MRASDKIVLIDKLGRALQSKFRYEEIDAFLAHYDIKTSRHITTNSKWVYSKEALQGVAVDILLKIADELEVEVPGTTRFRSSPPRNWRDTPDLVSSSATFQRIRTRLPASKRVLHRLPSMASWRMRT